MPHYRSSKLEYSERSTYIYRAAVSQYVTEEKPSGLMSLTTYQRMSAALLGSPILLAHA